jgi:tRNA (cmo5U34)-methyltransferase
MSHSVESHLAVAPAIYDVEIRRFVPGYQAMIEEAVAAICEHVQPDATIVDLGAGTGALSERIALRLPAARLVLVDADRSMLERASERLSAHRSRVEMRHGSFVDPLPRCDAAVASLSLHHLHARKDKCAVYAGIRRALGPGGVLVNADAAVPAGNALREPLMRRWAGHLVSHGDTEEQAFARFAQWAVEDRYFGIDEELEMLRQAGFEEVDVRWRVGPTSVIVARAAAG